MQFQFGDAEAGDNCDGFHVVLPPGDGLCGELGKPRPMARQGASQAGRRQPRLPFGLSSFVAPPEPAKRSKPKPKPAAAGGMEEEDVMDVPGLIEAVAGGKGSRKGQAQPAPADPVPVVEGGEEPSVWDIIFPEGMDVLDQPFVPQGAGQASGSHLGVVSAYAELLY